MKSSNKCRFNACACLAVILAIIIGVAVGILFAFCFIPFIKIALWIIFGLGVLALIILFIALFLTTPYFPNPLRDCLCKNIACLLAGIFGSIITALIALSVILYPLYIVSAIIVGIAVFFFVLLIIALISLIKCILREGKAND